MSAADPAPLSPAELADLRTDAQRQPAIWHGAHGCIYVRSVNGDTMYLEAWAMNDAARQVIGERTARILNAAPALIATVEQQAKRIADLEAGLRGASNTLAGRSDVAQRKYVASLGYALLATAAPKVTP